MQCPKCDAENVDAAKFCRGCGGALPEAESPSACEPSKAKSPNILFGLGGTLLGGLGGYFIASVIHPAPGPREKVEALANAIKDQDFVSLVDAMPPQMIWKEFVAHSDGMSFDQLQERFKKDNPIADGEGYPIITSVSQASFAPNGAVATVLATSSQTKGSGKWNYVFTLQTRKGNWEITKMDRDYVSGDPATDADAAVVVDEVDQEGVLEAGADAAAEAVQKDK
jgi:hypothetical protein